MSSENVHFNTTDGIEDVELEEDLDDSTMDELIKERNASASQAVSEYREAVTGQNESPGSDVVEKSDTDDSGGPVEDIEHTPARTSGEVIKQTGIARLGVDLTDEDEDAMTELIKDAHHDDVEVGLREGQSDDPTHDAIQKGTSGVRERFERDIAVVDLSPSEQATTLAKEAAEDVGIASLVQEASQLPKSPTAVREQVYEKVYTDITKFVRTIYSENAVDRDVLNTVREKIAGDAARRAMVARKANEDGVTVDAEGYDPEDGGMEVIEDEGTDGGETDAPTTENDSEDVNLEGDVDLSGE